MISWCNHVQWIVLHRWKKISCLQWSLNQCLVYNPSKRCEVKPMNVVALCTLDAAAYTLDITLSSDAHLNRNSRRTLCPFAVIEEMLGIYLYIKESLERIKWGSVRLYPRNTICMPVQESITIWRFYHKLQLHWCLTYIDTWIPYLTLQHVPECKELKAKGLR